jgi:hypothetical protein
MAAATAPVRGPAAAAPAAMCSTSVGTPRHRRQRRRLAACAAADPAQIGGAPPEMTHDGGGGGGRVVVYDLSDQVVDYDKVGWRWPWHVHVGEAAASTLHTMQTEPAASRFADV